MNRRAAFVAVLTCLAIASPYIGVLPAWTPAVATVVAFTALGLLGLNLIFGVAGMLALGQAAFMALPGYLSGMLERTGLTLWIAAPIGIIATILIARAVAEVFVRLPGVYFAVGTLGFAFVVEGLARAFPDVTGGASGFVFDEGRALSGGAWYTIAIVLLAIGVWRYAHLVQGAFLRKLSIIRHDELAAAVMGINVAKSKANAFAVGSAFSAVAGICLAYYVGVLVPESAGVNRSLEQVGTVMLGGLSSLIGPVVGSFIVQWLFVVAGYGKRYELLVYGLAFLGAVLYARHGIVGLARRPWHRLMARLESGTATVPSMAVEPAPSTASNQVAAGDREGMCLRVSGLCKHFGGLQAVQDVSFEVAHGEIFTMVGPNGAGKSTLFNVISGIEPPTSGTIEVRGRDLLAAPIHARAAIIGRSFQVARLVPDMTTLENVMVRLDQISPALTEPARRAAALAQLADFELDHLANRLIRELSIGQHKLIDLARAAVGRPPLVLLDEPAVGLSATELEHLRRLLDRLRETRSAVVIVEHNIQFVASIADRGIVLDGGRVIAHGAIHAILNDSGVREAYFGVLT